MGACAFYHAIWIPHYAHVVEPIYGLLKKGRKYEWSEEHTEAVRRLNEMLTATLESRIQTRHSGLHDSRHQLDRNQMDRKSGRREWRMFSHPVQRKGVKRATTRICPGQTQTMGYRFGGEGRQGLLNRDGLPTDSRYGFRMRNSSSSDIQMDCVDQVFESGNTAHFRER